MCSHAIRMRVVLVFMFAATAVASAQPREMQDLDPLREGPPEIRQELRFDAVESPAGEKLVAPLRSKLRTKTAQPAGGRLRVIVTLQEPTIDWSLEPPGQKPHEVRARYLGAMAHHFVRRAAAVGFRAERGFSLFPIVVGEVRIDNLEKVAALPSVRWIEEERIYMATRTQGGALMRADDLRNQLGATGLGVGVAVLDTGIDWTHLELAGRVVAQGDFTGTTGSGFDDQGHGTAVAGIIAGSAGGMAPQANLWAVKVLRQNGSGTTTMIIAGLQAVFADRLNFGGVHVVNMSLGGGGPFNAFCDSLVPSYTQVFLSLLQADILVLVASGNDAFKNGISLPACHSLNFSVGAVYDAYIGPAIFGNCFDFFTFSDLVTCYSNSGLTLDFLAPSHCSVTPALGGGNESCFGGTSAATPYAAGVAAQLLSLNPDTTPIEMFFLLSTTGVPITDPANSLTRPRVDALAAGRELTSIFADGFESGDTTSWSG